MESKIDELLQQLHLYLFADSQQIIVELRHYLHDFDQQEGDIAFISSKIFNSSHSLLEFLRKNIRENDKLIAGIKKKLFEVICEFMDRKPNHVHSYLQQIIDTCIRSFAADQNALVREASLQLLIRIIHQYPLATLNKFINSKDLLFKLLDEIKHKRPSASVKGSIWNLVGLCHQKFKDDLQMSITESQDQMYIELKSQLDSKKPEFRAIIGIIKGMNLSLEDRNSLDDDQVEGLFIRVKTGMQPMQDVKHKGIQKQSMKLFTNHVNLFKQIIPRHAEPMVRLTLQLCVDPTLEVRDAANDMLGKLMQAISDGLTIDQTIHKDIFREIIGQFKKILEDPDNNVQLISAIKAIGVFSKAIKIFMSEEMLMTYLDRLIELSEAKLIKEFEQQQSPEEDVQNFKYILKKQKQLISYIESYSYILLELSEAPSEGIQAHFYKVCCIGISNHRKLYDKYKHRFYEALVSLIMGLASHHHIFPQWIRKFVRHTLQETLKIPDAAIFGGESPEESLKDGIQFWKEWLNKDKLWSDFNCRKVYDDLLYAIIEDIQDINLNYDIKVEQKNTDEESIESPSMVTYQAHNDNHQLYFKRLADFLEVFLPNCHNEWLLKWIPRISEVLIRKCIETPRIPKIYQILRTLMQTCNKYKYFEDEKDKQDQDVDVDMECENDENIQTIDAGEKANVFNSLLQFFKDLIGKSEEYQDELLFCCIDLLLQVPLALLYNKDSGTDNVELWKGVMIKALELGRTNNGIAMTCINMLEQWFSQLPPNTTVKLYREIIPQLSDFLNAEVDHGDNPEYFHQRVLKKELEFGQTSFTTRDISNKVLDLLGKIGGYAHNIINNEISKKHDKENFIRWDPEKRLKFSLPLYNTKVDIYFDSCLPRVVELVQNSTNKEVRLASCEFLHSLIIFMIGKNAQKPRNQKGQRHVKQQEMAAFAKLYTKLFPVIIKLATDVELVPRQLFKPLCFQIVRWFSSSKIYEHPEVESLLDSLIEGAQNKNNSSLRQLCSDAVAEFAKWSLKQMSDKEIQENPANMKSLIRRIQSNSNHPDPFKRLSSVLCFNQIFPIIREFDPLIDRFCLEICYSVLQSLKMCYDQPEQSHEVIDTSIKLLPKIKKVILRKWGVLMQENGNRCIVDSLETMLVYMFERFKSFETTYREESIKLWEGLVKESPPAATAENRIPNDFKSWIVDYYCPKRKQLSILRQLNEIDFENKQEILDRKTKLVVQKKSLDQLTAQLDLMHWLLTKGKFTLSELHKLDFNSQAVSKSINSFLKHHICQVFMKRKLDISQKVSVCKEDREQVTRSQIITLTKIYSLVNLITQKIELGGQDTQMNKWLKSTVNGLDFGLGKEQQFFAQTAIFIVLLPQVFKIQLLVENRDSESQLRKQALEYLENLSEKGSDKGIIKTLITQSASVVTILDLSKIMTSNSSVYSPRLTLNLCLGYLKLCDVDSSLKAYLSAQINEEVTEDKLCFKQVIELWLNGDSPFENESGRILVKFMSKLLIPDQVLLEWITLKTASVVYQKCSDLLLQYIADQWSEQREEPEQKMEGIVEGSSLVEANLSDLKIDEKGEAEEKHYSCLGEFLVAKIQRHQAQLYPVFIPIIEKLAQSNGSQNYLKILIEHIPVYCEREIRHEFKDVAINHIRLLCLISVKGKALLMNAQDEKAQIFVEYVTKRISSFLKEKFSVYVKKEVFNLLSLVADFPIKQGMINTTALQRMDPSLNYVKKMHFPLKSSELKPQSNEAQNFLVIVQAFLNLAIVTKNLKVLRHLYQLIREHKTTFEGQLKNAINIIVTQQINTLPTKQFVDRATEFVREFMDRNMDQGVCDNIRWAVAEKIIKRILETCPQDKLVELMLECNSAFMNVLERTDFSEFVDQPNEFFNLVREKTLIMNFYEILYRRVPVQVIKETVHVKLYGTACEKNELSMALITIAAQAKKELIPGFQAHCGHIASEDPPSDLTKDLNSPSSIQTRYSCSAYTLLSSVIVCTQTKEAAFAKFLFSSRQGAAAESLWSLIIDTSKEYEFEVQTNFNHIELRSIEQKLADSQQATRDAASARVQGMMNEYLTSSFMGGNEGFNQNMVFETQLDKGQIKQEGEKLQEVFDQKFSSSRGASQSPPSLPSQEMAVNGDQELEGSDEAGGKFLSEADAQFELDDVNSHQCMKNIKRCIERMKVLFSEDWKRQSSQMPQFAKNLLEGYSQPGTHINIKIFILKIVSNDPSLFKPYAHLWFQPVCEYLTTTNQQSKGFHYFLRDLCTMLISWDFVPEDSPDSRKLLTLVINSLILISADKIKLIFKQNIQIISVLMRKWRGLVAIDKRFVAKMLSLSDSERESHLWKMNAIEILALAVCYGVPVLAKVSENELMPQSERKFSLQIKGNRPDPLMSALLEMYESKKKQLIYASSELVGMILNSQTSSPAFEELLKSCKVRIFANELRERHDVFVYSIEHAQREYSQLLSDRQIFMKMVSFISVLTGSMRAAVFKTLERYVPLAKQNKNLAAVDEIAMSLFAESKEILADINDANQQAFVSLLVTLQQLKGVDSVEKLLAVVVPQLKHLFIKNKNEYSRGRFYDLMVNLYDRYEDYRTHPSVQGSLVHGLSDSSKMIRDKLVQFWNDQNRLELDPLTRLQQLMDVMYVTDEEGIWLTNSAYLLLQVSCRSSDYNRKIFEEPLQECQFAPMHVDMTGAGGMMNRSQPMTPLFTQVDQMIQASQNAQGEQQPEQSENQDQIPSQAQTGKDAKRAIGARAMAAKEQADMEQGFVRATQLPQFTLTQAQPSALIAGFRANAAGTLSDSFYGINQKQEANEKSPHKVQPQLQEGVKGGTKLFTISEEGEGEEENRQAPGQSQDSDGFIAPAPVKRKGNQFSEFFKKINFAYKPMEVTGGTKIRFVHEATMPSHLARQEEIRRVQRSQFIGRQLKQRKNQVNLYRQYRIGELPDIQIDYKDMLMPLMAIVRADSTIATEIFVEIFKEIYKDQVDKQIRQTLGAGLTSILATSKLFDYPVMNCAHRIAIELLKIDGFTIDSEIIERTGEHSMSFQTSLILLEESLIHGDLQTDSLEQDKSKKLKQDSSIRAAPSIDATNRSMHSITSQNRQYWFKLIKLYEIIGNQDALHGIWCQLAQQDGLMFRREAGNQGLSQEQNNDPNQSAVQKEQEQVVNLIKEAQDLKNKGRIEDALSEMESILKRPDLCIDFEDSVKRELQTKKLEYKAELLKWDQISTELLEVNKGKQLHEIAGTAGFKQVNLMIRSQIREQDHWENLTGQVNYWMTDDYSKAMLEKNFSYEMAMLFLTQLDYDRARIYIEREAAELLLQWKNLTKLSQVAQHFLVQRIQKIYEMKEFINLVKTDGSNTHSKDEIMKKIVHSISDWKQRSPSESFDPLSVWDDIAQARQFFIDQYAMTFQDTPLQQTLLGNPIKLDGSQPEFERELKSLSGIPVMLHIQTAKGAFKMGAYDSSDCYLKKAQKNRQKNQSCQGDMRIIVPIIKLKAEQNKSQIRNIPFDAKKAYTEKIYRIFIKKMGTNHHDLATLVDTVNIDPQGKEHFCQNPSLESIKTVIKSNLLKFNLQKKLFSIHLEEATTSQTPELHQTSINQYLEMCFTSLESSRKYLSYGCSLNKVNSNTWSPTGEQQVYITHQQGKTLYRLAKYSDKLLRKMEANDAGSQLINQGLLSLNNSESNLAKTTISSGLQALNMGYQQASDIIPRMLDVLSRYQDNVRVEFQEQSENTPAWFFLRWISQIAAVLNRPESTIIEKLVSKIASKYPQALYYPFKVIDSNAEIDLMPSTQSQLFLSLQLKFKSFRLLNQWAEALDCLIFPEHRFKYWYQLVCDTYQDPAMEQSLRQETQARNMKGGTLLQKIQKIVLMMYTDILSDSKPMVGQEIGVYNRQFIQKWEPEFTKRFGKDGNKVLRLDLTTLITELQNIQKKIGASQLYRGNEQISKYSEWLDKLDCNEFYQVKNYIEIPGQYESSKSEPIAQKNVKIASIKKTCLVLASIRGPKKITIHGSNEKDYHILVKGGEDLRLDQRVQQLFGIMNRIFQEDPACENRDINLKTFTVVPISNRLGTLEWVDSTEPMKALISKEHQRLEGGKDIHESRAYSQRMNWLRKLPGNKGVTQPAQQHLALLKHTDNEVIRAFDEHQSAFPRYLLRNALENLCLTSSAFLTIKNQFIKSMAVFSVASYLIGIGDRHLENFLIDTTDGEVFGIDFGIAFGSSVHLSIPELMPFRLTQQIEGVIAPHPLQGIYKQTMVHALSAMRKKKSLILDTCEIFVKEPLLDWVKDAKQRNRGQNGSGVGSISSAGQGVGSIMSIDQNNDQLDWYPRQKIELVKKKLQGINPVRILYRELKESQHSKKDYMKTLEKAIQGPDDGVRYYHLSERSQIKYMEVEDQVDILIELARDPNILGRTWVGWSPYI